MILLFLNIAVATFYRMIEWFTSQSTPRLILLFQGFLLLIYLALVIISYFSLSTTYTYTIAVRVPVTSETLWDHIEDIRKNPISASYQVTTTRISDTEWHEEIGSNEIIQCHTKDVNKPKQLVRECWVEAVHMKAQLTYLIRNADYNNNDTTTMRESKNNNNNNDDNTPSKSTSESPSTTTTTTATSTMTILRIFVSVEAIWGSFFTPMLRLVLTFRPRIMEHVVKDYLKQICLDMGVQYQIAEVWE